MAAGFRRPITLETELGRVRHKGSFLNADDEIANT